MKGVRYSFFIVLALLTRVGQPFESIMELRRVAESIAREMNCDIEMNAMAKHNIITDLRDIGMIRFDKKTSRNEVRLTKELEDFLYEWIVVDSNELAEDRRTFKKFRKELDDFMSKWDVFGTSKPTSKEVTHENE